MPLAFVFFKHSLNLFIKLWVIIPKLLCHILVHRAFADLENLGGDGKYSKTVVCPDGCVIFRLTATPLGNENFHKGQFYDYPDQT